MIMHNIFGSSAESKAIAPSTKEPVRTTTETSGLDCQTSHGYVLCLQCRQKTLLEESGVDSLEVNVFLAEAADRLAQKMTVCGTSDLLFHSFMTCVNDSRL